MPDFWTRIHVLLPEKLQKGFESEKEILDPHKSFFCVILSRLSVNQPANNQTDTGENIASLAEVINREKQLVLTLKLYPNNTLI